MARAVFNAPPVPGLDTATKAANATKYRHTTRTMPNVAVPVWFWHYGTYGGVTGEFGHVVVWVPGRGFLTSPWYLAHGQEWYSTLEEVERRFNAKYRFWSEDINGLRVAEPGHSPNSQEDGEMQSINLAGKHLFGVNNEFITHYGDTNQAKIARQVMSATDEEHKLTVAQFNHLLDGLGIPRNVVRDGTVLNPQSGKFEKNGTWSRNREILAKLGVK